MDVLCADKTGTLTQNKIALSLHLDIRGQRCERTLEYAYLNSRHQSGLKSLLDEAVVRHVEIGEDVRPNDHYRCVDEIPFDFARRRLSVILAPRAAASLGRRGRPRDCSSASQLGWRARPASTCSFARAPSRNSSRPAPIANSTASREDSTRSCGNRRGRKHGRSTRKGFASWQSPIKRSPAPRRAIRWRRKAA